MASFEIVCELTCVTGRGGKGEMEGGKERGIPREEKFACSSVAKALSWMLKALGSIPSPFPSYNLSGHFLPGVHLTDETMTFMDSSWPPLLHCFAASKNWCGVKTHYRSFIEGS